MIVIHQINYKKKIYRIKKIYKIYKIIMILIKTKLLKTMIIKKIKLKIKIFSLINN